MVAAGTIAHDAAPAASFRWPLALRPQAGLGSGASRAGNGAPLFLGLGPLADDSKQMLNGELTDLLRQCASGDGAAFRRLYDLQSARLYGLALRITRQPPLASDAVHDALLQVWRNAAAYDPSRGVPEAWLTNLVRYRAIDVMRKRGREQTGHDLPEQADDSPDPLQALMSDADGRRVRVCLDTLDERSRRVILLAFSDGLSHSELADRLATPLGTIKSWIRRGLQALKECLEP